METSAVNCPLCQRGFPWIVRATGGALVSPPSLFRTGASSVPSLRGGDAGVALARRARHAAGREPAGRLSWLPSSGSDQETSDPSTTALASGQVSPFTRNARSTEAPEAASLGCPDESTS